MKVQILAVGNRQPDWVAEACADYLKRMQRDVSVAVQEIKPEPRTSGKTAEQLMQAERIRLEQAMASGCRLVAMDEDGEDLSSQAFSKRMERWMRDGQSICIVIGGPDGLHPELLKRAHETLRLSSMTLPHGMARVLLCEQLYRASSLIKGHPYHRE